MPSVTRRRRVNLRFRRARELPSDVKHLGGREGGRSRERRRRDEAKQRRKGRCGRPTPVSAAALASASPRRVSSASRTRNLGDDCAGDYEEELDAGGDGVVNVGMLRWGWGMLVGSTLCFVMGVWSIAVGPFIDTEGVFVRPHR